MEYVITGIVCFILGLMVGIVMICLCKAVDNEEQETDPCDGCFGAANSDCWQCPMKNEER